MAGRRDALHGRQRAPGPGRGLPGLSTRTAATEHAAATPQALRAVFAYAPPRARAPSAPRRHGGLREQPAALQASEEDVQAPSSYRQTKRRAAPSMAWWVRHEGAAPPPPSRATLRRSSTFQPRLGQAVCPWHAPHPCSRRVRGRRFDLGFLACGSRRAFRTPTRLGTCVSSP